MTFNVAACRRFAANALAGEPPPHVVRVEPLGFVVARFVVPLDLCPTLNALAEMPHWKRGKIKQQLLMLMRIQHDGHLPTIPGRPWARAIRFSSVEPDRDAAWTKLPLDRCTSKNHGLGLIEDDRPSRLDLHFWWEPAPRGAGFVYLEIATGKANS